MPNHIDLKAFKQNQLLSIVAELMATGGGHEELADILQKLTTDQDGAASLFNLLILNPSSQSYKALILEYLQTHDSGKINTYKKRLKAVQKGTSKADPLISKAREKERERKRTHAKQIEIQQTLNGYSGVKSRREKAEQKKRAAKQRAAEEYRRKVDELHERKRKHELERIEKEKLERESYITALREIFSKEADLIDEADAHRDKRIDTLWSDLSDLIRRSYQDADSFYENHPDRHLIAPSTYQDAKAAFILLWLKKYTPENERGEKILPDEDQLRAILASEPRIQVTARAGSGKTTTLVTRAFLLLRKCMVPANEMLLLAFNRKAAHEIKSRLLIKMRPAADALIDSTFKKSIKQKKSKSSADILSIKAQAVDKVAKELNIELPHVMTFHALAYALVHPEESPLFDDNSTNNLSLSQTVQNIVTDALMKPEYEEKVKSLMMGHFKDDWEYIQKRGLDLKTPDEALEFLRNAAKETFNGEYVKSKGERLIANFLYEHSIPYKYECNHWWDNINYKPDFTVFRQVAPGQQAQGVVIEFYGLVGDPDYDDQITEKRNYWQKSQGWDLIEIRAQDLKQFDDREAFYTWLSRKLDNYKVPIKRLTEAELWKSLKERMIYRYTFALKQFIGLCRKQQLSPDDLVEKCKTYQWYVPLEGEQIAYATERNFVDLAIPLYATYLEFVENSGKDDFDGLLEMAALGIGQGRTQFLRKDSQGDLKELQHIFVDEYQDFSKLFFKLITAIHEQNSKVNLFAVGDDWQAINGFAGSDLDYFNRFENHFPGDHKQVDIPTNYRSTSNIVKLGNVHMDGQGTPAKPFHKTTGIISTLNLAKFTPSSAETIKHGGDSITPALLRLISVELDKGNDIAILSRCNSLPYYHRKNIKPSRSTGQNGLELFQEHIRSHFPSNLQKKISVSTTHKYKGLEKDCIILVDVTSSRYPLFHIDWIFGRFLGQTETKIVEDDRRLFYVALTRARKNLYMIHEGSDDSNGKKSPSVFLSNLRAKQNITAPSWSTYPVPEEIKNNYISILLTNTPSPGDNGTFEIKDQIIACGYTHKYQNEKWHGLCKTLKKSEFDIQSLSSEVWFASADGIEVQILNGNDQITERYHIFNGRWRAH